MRPTLSADRIPIAYRAEGAGEPAVVLVHCWCGNQGFWNGAVAALKDRHRVVTLDLAGHGASGRGRARHTVEAFAQDVKAVVETLGLTKVILVGHSMGGPVTLEAARLMPDRVVKLIPIDTFHNVEEVWPEEQRAAFLKPFEEDFRVAVRTFVPQLMPPGTDRAVVKRVVDAMAACDPAMGVSAMRALMDYPEAERIATVKVPIHAISGDLFPTDLAANRRHAPQFEVTVMKGTGHFPMWERAREFESTLVEAVKPST
jgi:pimeloyl-ACP methyl ester carboxylesterase